MLLLASDASKSCHPECPLARYYQQVASKQHVSQLQCHLCETHSPLKVEWPTVDTPCVVFDDTGCIMRKSPGLTLATT